MHHLRSDDMANRAERQQERFFPFALGELFMVRERTCVLLEQTKEEAALEFGGVDVFQLAFGRFGFFFGKAFAECAPEPEHVAIRLFEPVEHAIVENDEGDVVVAMLDHSN